MEAVAELRVLLASGQSLVTVTTTEESRLLAILREAGGTAPLWTWSSGERAPARRRRRRSTAPNRPTRSSTTSPR